MLLKRKHAIAGLALIVLVTVGATAQDTVQPDMVYVNVTVSSGRNTFVPGMTAENFKIVEDSANQNISYFSPAKSPISIAIVLADKKLQTGSVDAESKLVRDAAKSIEDSLTPGSNYLFNELKTGTGATLPGAIGGALTVMAEQPNPKRAIVMITDGFDNSAEPGDPLIELSRNAAVPTYIILLQERAPAAFDQAYSQMIADSGGRIFNTLSIEGLDASVKSLMSELNNEYVLGFKSTNTAKDNKWRKLKITLNAPAGSPKMDVNAKPRYFAAKPAKK